MKKLNFAFVACLFAMNVNASPVAQIKFGPTVTNEVKEIVKDDLNFLFSINSNGKTELFAEVFGEFSGSNFNKILTQNFTTIEMKDSSLFGVVSVAPVLYPNTLILNSKHYPGVSPRIARVAQYIWASRVEKSQPTNCPVPFLDNNGNDVTSIYTGEKQAGLPNCDIDVKGAYASTAIFLNNISKSCINCSDSEKSEANALSNYYLQHVSSLEVKEKIIKDSL